MQLGQRLLIGPIIALGLDDDYLIQLRRKKKRSFPFTPLGKLRKLGNVTLSVVDFWGNDTKMNAVVKLLLKV